MPSTPIEELGEKIIMNRENEGQHLFVLGSGFELLPERMTEVYGERGSVQRAIAHFFASSEARGSCRYAETLDDIPEITHDEIKMCIERQNAFQKWAMDIVDQYDKRAHDHELTAEDYQQLSAILGICPGPTEAEDTLFPHLVDLDIPIGEGRAEEDKKIDDAIANHTRLIEMMVDSLIDSLRNGQIFHSYGRDLYSQGYARYYFRGENAYNCTSKASLFRGMSGSVFDNLEELLIGETKASEFAIYLYNFNCITSWPYGDVFHGAIAQHYGIRTSWIDVTPNLETALFFACCRYDNEDGKWRPLRSDEIEKKDSRPSIEKRGGDSRYGILFSEPADLANLVCAANDPRLRFTYAVPIGYQPFFRCQSQHGYLVFSHPAHDLFLDRSFAKVKFRHSEELCQWIFERMDGGEKIYPRKGEKEISLLAEMINSSNCFSRAAFMNAAQRLGIPAAQTDEYEQRLKTRNILLVEKNDWLTAEQIEMVNKTYTPETIEQYLPDHPSLRPGLCI